MAEKWKPKIPDYKNQPKVDIEAIKRRNLELLKKGLGKKIKPDKDQIIKVVELMPSNEIASCVKIQPEKPIFSNVVNIEDFMIPGGKVNMKAYGDALKRATHPDEAKMAKEENEKYAPTQSENKLINEIDDTLAKIKAEQGKDEKQFDKEIDEILEKLE
ncbi:MAG: hypothetical protein M1334_01105 [Patescibacteria group bacterium]|nr:hypothetical protein [Patescibacteria group bacterium]